MTFYHLKMIPKAKIISCVPIANTYFNWSVWGFGKDFLVGLHETHPMPVTHGMVIIHHTNTHMHIPTENHSHMHTCTHTANTQTPTVQCHRNVHHPLQRCNELPMEVMLKRHHIRAIPIALI